MQGAGVAIRIFRHYRRESARQSYRPSGVSIRLPIAIWPHRPDGPTATAPDPAPSASSFRRIWSYYVTTDMYFLLLRNHYKSESEELARFFSASISSRMICHCSREARIIAASMMEWSCTTRENQLTDSLYRPRRRYSSPIRHMRRALLLASRFVSNTGTYASRAYSRNRLSSSVCPSLRYIQAM